MTRALSSRGPPRRSGSRLPAPLRLRTHDVCSFQASRRVFEAFTALSLVCAACGTPPESTGPLIVIDGEFADWDTVPPLLVDPSENGPGAVDFGEIRAESDDSAVYFALDFGRTVNAQAMQGSVVLELDTDDDVTTGYQDFGLAGADRVVTFSTAPSRLFGSATTGSGIVTDDPGVYGIGFDYAPTWASRYFEVRLDRRIFTADTLRGRLSYATPDRETADETEVFTVALRPPVGRAARRADAAAVSRSPEAGFRLLSWNVGDRGPVTATESFDRLVRALAPDVIMLDEVARDIGADWFERSFAALGGEWTVIRGASGGRQTALIASRLPLEPVASLAGMEYPDSIYLLGETASRQLQIDLATAPADRMPVLGASLQTGSSRLLLVTFDLPCCGHAGSAEDRARIMMADAVNRAVGQAVAATDIDGVIVAGDLNLVGSRTPLDRLLTGLDPAGGDLAPVPALRLDRGSSATWWNASDRFPPGRLDWVLYSRSLEPVRAFVFDVSDISPEAAQSLGIDAGDSDAVSDHRPVIVDFAVR